MDRVRPSRRNPVTSATAPRSDASLTQRGDLPTREYAGFFRDLTTAFNLAANLPQDIQALTVRVDALEEEAGAQIGNVVGDSSIVTDGVLQGGVVTVHLLNDVDIAPALSFYGAITEGVKGWQTFSGNFAALDNGDSTYSLDLSDLANSGVGTALVKITRDGKGRISGTEAATTTDLAEGSSLYFTDARADARITTAKADPNGVASLVGGKLDAGQLPALAITETFVVASQAAMLALTCQQGDVAVRTDLNKSLILTASPPSTLANWQELLAPTGTVASFNGRTGSVVPASGDYTAAQVGLGNVDNTSDANKPVSTAQQTALDALIPPGYIDGLKMVWVSGTALTVTTGAAYIPSLGKVLRASSDIAKTGLSLTASTWYHVYLYNNAGTPDIELSTTAPAAPYSGTARTKMGDTSRRYVGSARTDTAGGIYNFLHCGTSVTYRNVQGGSPFRVLSNGTAITETTVSMAAVVPVTSKQVFVRVINNATSAATAQIYTGVSDDSAAGPPTSGIMTFDPTKDGFVYHPLDSSQSMTYWYRTAPSGGGAYMDIYGYHYER